MLLSSPEIGYTAEVAKLLDDASISNEYIDWIKPHSLIEICGSVVLWVSAGGIIYVARQSACCLCTSGVILTLYSGRARARVCSIELCVSFLNAFNLQSFISNLMKSSLCVCVCVCVCRFKIDH